MAPSKPSFSIKTASIKPPVRRLLPLALAAIAFHSPVHADDLLQRVTIDGSRANQLGVADAASSGSVSQKELAARTVYRAGELLEAMPGLIVSQHSGEGKANQFYLRGFNLDHGTDLRTTVCLLYTSPSPRD